MERGQEIFAMNLRKKGRIWKRVKGPEEEEERVVWFVIVCRVNTLLLGNCVPTDSGSSKRSSVGLAKRLAC